jgi:hypothetical protein
MAGGGVVSKILEDYFPILIDTGAKLDQEKALPQGMIFIDRNGEKFEPELVNAVLNGVEIDT